MGHLVSTIRLALLAVLLATTLLWMAAPAVLLADSSDDLEGFSYELAVQVLGLPVAAGALLVLLAHLIRRGRLFIPVLLPVEAAFIPAVSPRSPPL